MCSLILTKLVSASLKYQPFRFDLLFRSTFKDGHAVLQSEIDNIQITMLKLSTYLKIAIKISFSKPVTFKLKLCVFWKTIC